jgi:hypothetical protein
MANFSERRESRTAASPKTEGNAIGDALRDAISSLVIVAGAVLVVLGSIGFVFRQNKEWGGDPSQAQEKANGNDDAETRALKKWPSRHHKYSGSEMLRQNCVKPQFCCGLPTTVDKTSTKLEPMCNFIRSPRTKPPSWLFRVMDRYVRSANPRAIHEAGGRPA